MPFGKRTTNLQGWTWAFDWQGREEQPLNRLDALGRVLLHHADEGPTDEVSEGMAFLESVPWWQKGESAVGYQAVSRSSGLIWTSAQI